MDDTTKRLLAEYSQEMKLQPMSGFLSVEQLIESHRRQRDVISMYVNEDRDEKKRQRDEMYANFDAEFLDELRNEIYTTFARYQLMLIEAGERRRSAEYTPLSLAVLFHDTYEALAPGFGYETRQETRAFNPESSNGKLMIAVCAAILKQLGRK